MSNYYKLNYNKDKIINHNHVPSPETPVPEKEQLAEDLFNRNWATFLDQYNREQAASRAQTVETS